MPHLSKKVRRIVIVVTLVLVIAIGGYVAWKWGMELYTDAHDFVTFPELHTPLDVTSAVMSVVSEVTSHVVGAFSTATAAVAGAEATATAAVAGAAGTAGDAIKDGFGGATKALGGIFG